MGDRLTKLSNLLISRVAFVGAGDNPDARIVIWKSRDEGGGTMGDDVLKNALEALRARSDAAKRTVDDVSAGVNRLAGGPATISKADEAVARLDALVEKYLDRHPVDRHGDDTTPEAALEAVSRTTQGKRAIAAVRDAGREGQEAFAKTFDGIVEEPASSMSAGYAKVEAIAKGLREADPALTEAQSIAKAYETPEGRAAAAEYRAERVSA